MKSLLQVLAFLLISSALCAQNIAINQSGAAADASALLDISSTNKGLLIPRVALTSSSDAATISSPTTSLLVYNNGTGGLTPAGYYYNSGTSGSPNWVILKNGGSSSTDWTTTGNSGTTAGTNFIGTTDNIAWVIKTNNAERVRVLGTGEVGIGTYTPSLALHVVSNIPTGSPLLHPYRAGQIVEGDQNTMGGRIALRQVASNPVLTFYRNNGTLASPTAVVSGDIIGNLAYGGYDGTNYFGTYGLLGIASENWTTSGHGMDYAFYTVNNTSTSGTEKVRITSEGDVGIGTSAPIAKLHTTATYTVDADAYGMYNWITSTPSLSATRTHYGFQNNLLFRPTENGNAARGYGVYNRAYTDGTYTFQHLRGAMNLAYSNSTSATDQDNIVGSYNQGYNNSTGTVTNVYGSYSDGINNENSAGTGVVTALYGSWNRAYVNAGTTTNAFGAYNYALKNTTGNITAAYGSYNRVRNSDATGTGTIATAYGVYSQIEKNAAGNDYTNSYGLFANLAAGATRWGVYTQNEDKNYFSGSVGIGTTTPPTKLSVYVTGSTDGITLDGTTYPQMVFKENGTVRAQLGIPTTAGGYDPAAVVGDIVFRTTGGKMIFATNGGVGIAALTLSGANGNVGIGTTSPGYKLEVNGRLKTTGINETSDQRMKTNVSTIEHALKGIKEMRGVKFNWDTVSFPDKKFESSRQIGLIAQEVEKVFPELVRTDNNGYKSVEYSKLVAVLIEALKEQTTIIDAQNKSISDMRSEITSLKGEMDNIRQLVENTLELKINSNTNTQSSHK